MFFKGSLLFEGKLTSIPGHPYSALEGAFRVALEPTLQDARYVIKSVICDPNFGRLVLGCIDADFCK